MLSECGHFGLGYGVEGGAECAYALFERRASRWQVGAHPGLDGAVVSQNKDSTIRVILLGREGGCVDGDMWISVREELVGVCRAGSPGPEVFEVLFKVRVLAVERV